MRTRIYVDGKPAWSPNVPASANLSGFGGSLVTARPPVKVYLPAAKSTGAPKAYSLHVENRRPLADDRRLAQLRSASKAYRERRRTTGEYPVSGDDNAPNVLDNRGVEPTEYRGLP